MTIEEYIKSKDAFSLMPFTTIYVAICELTNDGFIDEKAFGKGGGENVAVHKLEPPKQGCRGLYSAGDFHSNR